MCLGRWLFVVFLAGVPAQELNPLVPSPKTWWAKEIIPGELYTAGRLTDTQIKYASEVGFKSIISNFNFTSPDQIGEEYLPTSDEAQEIATQLAGLYYGVVLEPGESYATVQAIEKFTALMAVAPRPVLFNCRLSYTASYAAMNYLANQTVLDPEFSPRVNSSVLYEKLASLGHYHNSTAAKTVVSQITGEPFVVNPPRPDASNPIWQELFWLAKPVYQNIYIAGQIRSSYVDMVSSLSNTLVNGRQRLSESGAPSQEEVTLLNIEDGTGTYTGSGRQSEERLLQTRIFPNKTNDYISGDSETNYASRNPLEFGDDIGYNKDVDQSFWEGQGFVWYNTPVGGEYTYNVAMWDQYRDTWLAASEPGTDVIFHCGTALRASVGALLTSGFRHGFDSDWALTRAVEMGIHFEEAGRDDIVQLFRDVLG